MSVKPCNDLKDNTYLSEKATMNRCVLRTDLTFQEKMHFNICRQPIPQIGGCTTMHHQMTWAKTLAPTLGNVVSRQMALASDNRWEAWLSGELQNALIKSLR